MTLEEAIEELQLTIDLIKQNGKDWLDERDIPILSMAVEAMKELNALREQNSPSQMPGTSDAVNRILAIETAIEAADEWDGGYNITREQIIRDALEKLPSVQPEWNNHTVACLLAEIYGDTCACNYNGIDEWLPEKCELLDSCPDPVGVACWEQYLTHRAERRTDETD